MGVAARAGAPAVFEAFARGIEGGAPAAAAVLRRCGRDEAALALVPDDPAWDVPHRLLAAVRWLVLAGEAEDFDTAPDPWPVFRAVLDDRGEWVARFVREQTVQTNEVQRCWALLPLFLTVARTARHPLDLIELGASAGLNLYWDRYSYRYAAGAWGDRGAGVRLDGEERSPVPAELLGARAVVRSRRGIDLSPIDVRSDEGIRLLSSFVTRADYRRRLEQAAEVVRADPPRLIRGDYLELLPALLRERADDALTVVFQTHSTVYLEEAERRRLRAIVDEAGAEAPLAWVSTPTPDEHAERRGDYPLELALWPGGGRRIVARTSVRADWLEWTG